MVERTLSMREVLGSMPSFSRKRKGREKEREKHNFAERGEERGGAAHLRESDAEVLQP